MDSWPGKIGEERAEKFDVFLDEMLPEYAAALGVGVEECLAAIEAKRNYSAINYYQRANFPSLDNVTLFDSMEQLHAAIDVKQGFRCPSCGGVSVDAYGCTLDGCDWKSWGLLGTMGHGLFVATKDTLIGRGRVDEIFMSICMEAAETAVTEES
ncbi:MAG: hypothetical protein GY803_23265 [Chloroflexi bacterium]|nr:hypothetical protein [Chloroflexota bacterium]